MSGDRDSPAPAVVVCTSSSSEVLQPLRRKVIWPVDEHGFDIPAKGGWRSRLFWGWSKAARRSCVWTWLCPGFTYAQITARMGFRGFAAALSAYFLLVYIPKVVGYYLLATSLWSFYHEAHVSASYSVYLKNGGEMVGQGPITALDPTFLFLLVPATLINLSLLTSLRTEVRRELRIYGSSCLDCVFSCCCQPCTLLQLSTQTGALGKGCTLAPPPVTQEAVRMQDLPSMREPLVIIDVAVVELPATSEEWPGPLPEASAVPSRTLPSS